MKNAGPVAVLLLLILGGAGTAHALVLSVGPGKQFPTIAAAAEAAASGDLIEIDAGTYREAVTWRADGLTVRGVGGRAVVDMTGMTISNEKAIFVSAGADFTVENVEFVGAAVPDLNGAGIRWEGAGYLVVRNCIFRGNENGILGGVMPENTATIDGNEFVDNGRGGFGFTHNVYISGGAEVTFRGNWSHALVPRTGDIGHLFKSRARVNYVLYNRVTAEGSASSYEINLPQGGEGYVIGNLIHQREGGQRTMLSFADGDGTQVPASKLYVVNNTFVNESTGPATFIRTTQAGAELHVLNNLVVGAGMLASGGVVTMANNVVTDAPGFVDAAAFDYRLTAGSPAIDAGADPGMAGDVVLAPALQYVHPAGFETRTTVGAAMDAGAFELGEIVGGDGPGGDGDGDADGDGGDDFDDGLSDGGVGGTTDEGGCCDSGHGAGASPLLALGLAALVLRRRRR